MCDRRNKKKFTEEENDKVIRRITRSAMDRVDGWVKEQYERHHNSSPLEESRSDMNCSFNGESAVDHDDPSEQDDVSLTDGGSRKPAFQYSKEIFEMKCEWTECDFSSKSVDGFVNHVASHSPQTESRESGTLYCCLWDSCGFDSGNWNIVVRHINYHSYHTKIKAIGTSIMKRSKLLDCALDYAGRNLLPVLPSQLVCEWDDCNYRTDNFQIFLYHVHCHVHILPGRKHNQHIQKVSCEWRDCKKKFSNGHKLRDHVRTHTQEKLVGCPVCGTQFSTKTKFYDHCKRQMPNQKKGFKCSHCRKNFATERILRDHIRLHVNLYKCPLCDMTCPFPSTLTLHIRYRHLDLKPFKCNFCEHRSKTERDLENHQLTHCSENFWVCEQEECDYSCRDKNVLQEHYVKNHGKNVEMYQFCCHICSKRYRRGADLTVHLKKEHSYRWASGHSRFKYVREEDGCFRLQTVRYESIEVTQEMMNKTNRVETVPAKRYKCVMDSPFSVIVKENKDLIGSEDGMENLPEKEDKENELMESEDQAEKSSGTKSRMLNSNEEANNKSELIRLDDSNSSDSSNFGETLKKYLGLTGTSSFIKVVKNNTEKS